MLAGQTRAHSRLYVHTQGDRTPLIWATCRGREAIVRYLLENGSYFDLQDDVSTMSLRKPMILRSLMRMNVLHREETLHCI
jgi:hypothetical protein